MLTVIHNKYSLVATATSVQINALTTEQEQGQIYQEMASSLSEYENLFGVEGDFQSAMRKQVFAKIVPIFKSIVDKAEKQKL